MVRHRDPGRLLPALLLLASTASAQPGSLDATGDMSPLAEAALIERPMLWAEQVLEGVVEEVDSAGVLTIRARESVVRVRLVRLVLPGSEHSRHEWALQELRHRLSRLQVHALIERRPAGDDPGTARLVRHGTDLREQVVAAGVAWYCAGARDEPGLRAAQQEARDAARGVWSSSEADVGVACRRPDDV